MNFCLDESDLWQQPKSIWNTNPWRVKPNLIEDLNLLDLNQYQFLNVATPILICMRMIYTFFYINVISLHGSRLIPFLCHLWIGMTSWKKYWNAFPLPSPFFEPRFVLHLREPSLPCYLSEWEEEVNPSLAQWHRKWNWHISSNIVTFTLSSCSWEKHESISSPKLRTWQCRPSRRKTEFKLAGHTDVNCKVVTLPISVFSFLWWICIHCEKILLKEL